MGRECLRAGTDYGSVRLSKEVIYLFFSKNKKTRALLIGISLAVSASFVVAGCGNKQQAQQQAGGEGAQQAKADDDVVDADYTEVKDK